MAKGRVPYRAAGLHDPDISLAKNFEISAKGHFAGKQKPHIEAAIRYAEAADALAKFGDGVDPNRRPNHEARIKMLGEDLSEHMLAAVRNGDHEVLGDLAEVARWIKWRLDVPASEGHFHQADRVRCEMIRYCLANGYKAGWRPTIRELADHLCRELGLNGMDDRQVTRMAKELGIEFQGSRKRQPDT